MIAEYYHGPRPVREVRAVYDAQTIRVYQAFDASVAHPAWTVDWCRQGSVESFWQSNKVVVTAITKTGQK